MISKRTVLILGAGASKPYGLPLGLELRKKILGMHPDTLDEEFLNGGGSTVYRGQGKEFLAAFRGSQFYSIDAFLGRRPEFEAVGKQAIAMQLQPAESADNLFNDDLDDHWYRELLHAMDADWENLSNNKIAFVTFNYDRSLELFMQKTFEARYQKSSRAAREIVDSFPMVHVYGKMGSLDPNASDFVPYGGGRDNQHTHEVVKSLRVIPDGRNDSAEFTKARELIAQADALCFLGFAFDKTNVERLGGRGINAGMSRSADGSNRFTDFAASTYGLTPAQRTAAAQSIATAREAYDLTPMMPDAMCLDTLKQTLILG